MTNQYSPIALFVYNRPRHTLETVEALLKNAEAVHSDLFIFSDAAKHEGDRSAVNEVRAFINQITGFKTITIIEREKNWGLANSIIDGVTGICEKYGKVIVLEDDIKTSVNFLKFMNDGLNKYASHPKVGSISAYFFPINVNLDKECFLYKNPGSWGWATWKDSWDLFEPDGSILLEQLKTRNLQNKFDEISVFSNIKTLRMQISGQNNSWFIRWAASLFLNNKLTLTPKYSLVNNIGIDGTGVHCGKWLLDPYKIKNINKEILVDCDADLYECKGKLLVFRLKVYLFRIIGMFLRR
jgi:hypothetical protein